MINDEVKQQILSELEPLFEQAKKNRLWFHSRYQNLWFSPKELRKYHSVGRFIWGAVNWELRDPFEQVTEISEKIIALENQKKNILNRIQEERLELINGR